jgi:hypothetical protein
VSFLAVEKTYISLLTCCISVVIVAIGASRIYRGLVEHPSFSHREARASSKSWDELQPEVGEVKDSHIV